MNKKELWKTNLLVSVILIFGFAVTAIFSYKANYQASLTNMEEVSSLTTEGIYYQLSEMFSKPFTTSMNMSRDILLADYLSRETENLGNEEYTRTIGQYLDAYRDTYGFDSVFLVSAATGRYYNFNGLDRVITKGNPENDWYFDLMCSTEESSMNVDNDEVSGSDNAITVFTNCKIRSGEGEVLGIIGTGIRVGYLKEFLKSYEDKYHLNVSLLDEDGYIEISSTHTGDGRTDWFNVNGQETVRERLLNWKEDSVNLELWTDKAGSQDISYIAARYIPELAWHLVVEQDTGKMVEEMRRNLYGSIIVVSVIILMVLVVITCVIRNFDRQITGMLEERQAEFKRATEQLYDNIYELNITKDCPANERTAQYFESLGAGNLPYSQALTVIADKQIKEAYREGYVSTFTPENVVRQYDMGNSHLKYDFMITQNGKDYYWMKIDAYVFCSQEDNCLHMFTYRKNTDNEKKKELQAATDEMTGFLNRGSVERKINWLLSSGAGQEKLCAFFLFDIDNFKQANDHHGHLFGDVCIIRFTDTIRRHLPEEAVLGRVGGDEFAAFCYVPDAAWVRAKAEELSEALRITCEKEDKSWDMSASIGAVIATAEGEDFSNLYEKADAALYRTKKRGKNGFTIY